MGRDEVILLDTHAAFWMANNDPSLGSQSRQLIVQALLSNDVAVSAISFWELALLVSKKRLVFHQPIANLRLRMIGSGIVEMPVSGEIAIAAVNLGNLHGDPANRFIVATAMAHGATLVTADKAILKWRGTLARQNAAK
jgi:PIN domain nuclease of toxin-antitoxin system